MEDLKIPLHFGVAVDEELIREKNPQVVLIATGAGKKQLPIPGADGANVADAKDYLEEKREPREHTVVIGGGLTGCEAAYYVAKQGKQVSVVEMQPDIMNVPGLCRANSGMLRDLLAFHHVDIYTGAGVQEIGEHEVVISHNGAKVSLPADQVILSVGYNPEPLPVHIPGIQVHEIGDCTGVGNLLHVIWGAYETVQNL